LDNPSTEGIGVRCASSLRLIASGVFENSSIFEKDPFYYPQNKYDDGLFEKLDI